MRTWHIKRERQLKLNMRPTSASWQPSFKLGGVVLWFGEDLGHIRGVRRAKTRRERVKVERKEQRRRYNK